MYFFQRLFLIAVFFLALNPVHSASPKVDDTPRIAVISAFALEQSLLHLQIEDATVYQFNGFEFTTGRINEHDVLLILSGVSMINAAMNTQLALERFNITHLIFSGIGGGIDANVNLGDVIVPAQWAQYQESIYAFVGASADFMLPLDFLPEVGGFQMIYPKPVTVRSDDQPDAHRMFWFEVDAALLARARQITERFSIANCIQDNACLTGFAPVKVGGNGLSGQAYVNNQAFRAYLIEEFAAQVIDMESAAVAQVAYSNGVPFIAFRGVSDIAGISSTPTDQYALEAADNVQRVVIAYLETFSGQAAAP